MRLPRFACAVFATVLLTAVPAFAQPCIVPDNGTGTVNLPPDGCGYVSPMDAHEIIDGLPPGTTVIVGAEHTKFFNVVAQPGGALGGEEETFDSILFMNMEGTGALTGFSRNIALQIQCVAHTGPRTPGDPVQTFPNDMFQLQGELFGDPDFDFLSITGGTGFGLPSPGSTTLTQLPGGDFNVDSFFDVTYQIDFVGAPGSVLDGMSGTTTATVTMAAGGPPPGGLCPVLVPGTPSPIQINEIRIDQPGGDDDEYFELIGPPGAPLDGFTYLVIGDGTAALGSGVIEAVVDLTGSVIPATGFFVAAESTFTLGVADLTTSLNFENSDNVTHMLVCGFTGAVGDDLDFDDDCAMDATPWVSVLDSIALVEDPAGGECNYGPVSVGPDGTFVPGHPQRCLDGGAWAVGAFDPAAGKDTPGGPNDCSPLNDECEDCIEIDADGSFPFMTTFATPSGVSPGCGGSLAPSDIWYCVTASCTGELTIDTCGSTYDSRLALYDACPVAGAVPTPIACNDDFCGLQSSITIPVTLGQVVIVQVGGFQTSTGVGVLNVACNEVCLPAADLACSANCETGRIDVSWTNPDSSGAISGFLLETTDSSGAVVFSDAASGDQDTYSFNIPDLGNGTYTMTVTTECTSGGTISASCTATISIYSGETNVIFAGETASGIDSVGALAAAFDATGKDYIIIDSLDYPCLDQLLGAPNGVLWMMNGSFPDDYALSATDAATVVGLLTSGVSVYHEAGDGWGFHTPTEWRDYDGVLGLEADGNINGDGNDSFQGMIGGSHSNVDVTGLDAVYNQDQTGNDWNDQIAPTGSDPLIGVDIPGDDAGVIWSDDGVGGSADPYDTAIFYKTSDPYGDVICQSWEFGGYGGDQNALADIYSDALKRIIIEEPFFVRGDCNADGGCDIADAITVLNYLFAGGSTSCLEACDANDDGGVDIGDAITKLDLLFGPGTPLPPPSSCGPDPTLDTLGCDSFPPCP